MTDDTTIIGTNQQTLSFVGPFGDSIPLLIGKCVIVGSVFWSSSDLLFAQLDTTDTLTQQVSFAVAFGKPDPNTQNTYISRLWVNGTLAYDATGKTPVTLDGLTITPYNGSEAQGVDPIIGASVGKYCPAFRGLIYAVIQGVNFANLSGYPTVVAEITQTNSLTYTVYQPAGTPDEIYTAALFNSGSDTLSLIGKNVIDVFDVDTETLLYSLPITLQGSPSPRSRTGSSSTLGQCFLSGDRLLTFGANLYTQDQYAYDLYCIDVDTGAVLGVSGPFDSTIELAVGKSGARVLGSDWSSYRGGLYLFTMAGNTATQQLLEPVSADGRGELFYNCLQAMNVGDYPVCMSQCQYIGRSLQPVIDVVLNPGSGDGGPAGPTTYTFNRGQYSNLVNAQPIGGIPSTIKLDTTDGFGATSYTYKTISAPDPSFFFGALDDFDLFYAVVNERSIARIIQTGGKPAVVGQIASQIGTSLNVRENPAPNFGYYPNADFVSLGPNEAAVPILSSDPEVVYGNLTGYTLLVATEPTIKRTSSGAIDIVYELSDPDEVIRWLMTGPIEDPYVAILVHNNATGVDVLRKFETFYSRQQSATVGDGGKFDANYYLLQGDDFYAQATFVNPPMRDEVFNHMQPFADLLVPTLPGQINVSPSEGADASAAMLRKPPGAGDGIFSYATSTQLVLLNLGALTVTTKDISEFVAPSAGAGVPAIPPQITYDAVTGLLYDPLSSINFFLNAGVPVGDTTLANVLQSMCEFCGFAPSQINTANLNAIDVQGAIINQSTSLTQLLEAIKDTFSLDVFDTNGQINFVRKTRGATFSFDLEVSESDLLPATENDNQTLIKYDRAYSADLPVTQTLEYIDGPNLGIVGTQTARRTAYPIKTTAADQTVDTSVPVIMSAASAIYWTNAMLFDAWASALTATLRLGPEGFTLDPGDYLAVNRGDGTQEAIRVTGVTLNTDRTVTVEGSSLVQFNDFDSPDIQAPTVNVAALAKTTPPVAAIFENVLFQIADDASAASIPLRYTSDQPVTLAVYANGAYAPEGGVRTASPVGTLIAAMPQTFAKGGTLCLWETDNQSRVLVRFKTKPTLSGTMMLVGQPGRWELVFYATATPVDPTGLAWAFSGLQRGRRGTDAYVNASRAGDVAAFPSSIDAMGLFTAPVATAGAGLPVRMAPTAGVGAATSTSLTPGATHAPWAPCGLSCDRSASATQAGRFDMAFAWLRRTRDETSMLHDGDGNVPNEFGVELYAFTLSVGASLAHTDTAGVSSFVYTAEQQIADGLANDPASMILSVCQIGNGLNGIYAKQQFTFT